MPNYMNSSGRTKALAEGIYLWAILQDMPARKVHGSPEQRAFNAWRERHGGEMEVTAMQEQYNLFDRVNGREWG